MQAVLQTPYAGDGHANRERDGAFNNAGYGIPLGYERAAVQSRRVGTAHRAVAVVLLLMGA